MGKVAVITANFGGFDTVKELPPQSVDYHRFYFTEKNSHVPMCGLDNRLRAKYYKMISHRSLERFETFIWIDGNVQIKSGTFVEDMIKALEGNDIAISRHPERKTVAQEAGFIIDGIQVGNKYLSSRYDAKAIKAEVDRYGDADGLYWCGLFARNNKPKTREAFEWWFMENCLMSNFDQLNFVHAVKDLRLNIVNWGNFYNNDTYSIHSHNYVK